MRKARILLILGIWVAILPYLGFPYSWKVVLFTLTGLGLIYFSYALYKNGKMTENKEGSFDNFKENGDFNKKEIQKESETVMEENLGKTEEI